MWVMMKLAVQTALAFSLMATASLAADMLSYERPSHKKAVKSAVYDDHCDRLVVKYRAPYHPRTEVVTLCHDRRNCRR